MRANGEIPAEELSEQKKVLVEQEQKLEGRIKDTEESNESWFENTENFLNTCFDARKIMSGDALEEKKTLISKIGSNLILKDRNLDMAFRKPYDVLLRVDPNLSWQGLVAYVENFYTPTYSIRL